MIRILQAFADGIKDGLSMSRENGWKYGIESKNSDETSDNEDDIAFYTVQNNRRKEIDEILTKQLENTTDENKRLTILNRLNSNDLNAFRDKKHIEKLGE